MTIFSISLFADIPKKDCGSDGYNCLPNCMQIYISNPTLPGTEAECKKNWDYFVAKKGWCMLTIMAFNGYGQKADPKLAKEYAQKADSSEDDGNCPAGSLVNEVDNRINGSTDNKADPINVCNLTSANSHGLCGSYANDNLKNKVKYDLHNFSAQLTAKQATAA